MMPRVPVGCQKGKREYEEEKSCNFIYGNSCYCVIT
mgnify:CR=1 FL=1